MKTYSSKSNAKRAAVREGLEVDTLAFNKDSEGRWFWNAPMTEQEVTEAEQALVEELDEGDQDLMNRFGTCNCPNCGIHLDNGAWTFDEALPDHLDPRSDAFKGDGMLTHDFWCMACDHNWGEKREVPAKKEGLKIEKNRPEQNGIKRPSAGGKCRAIWDACDALYAAGNQIPMPKDIKAVAAEKGWNANNAVIEMYQWRKFNGFKSRA